VVKYQNNHVSDARIVDFIIITLILGVSIFIGDRDLSLGADTVRYYNGYINGYSDRIEILFNYLTLFLKSIDADFSVLLTLVPFLLLTSLYTLAIKVTNDRVFSTIVILSVICTPFFYSLSLNVLRQALALSFFLWGITFRRKGLISFFVCSLLMHKFIIIVWCAYFISGFDMVRARTLFLLYFFLCVAAYFELSKVFLSIFIFINITDGYGLAETSRYDTGFRIDFILFNLLPFIIYYLKEKMTVTSYNSILSNRFLTFLMVGACIHIFFIYMPFSDRLALPFWFLYPFVFVLSIRLKLLELLTPLVAYISFSVLLFNLSVFSDF
jgi:hypothetical protein